MANSFLKAEKIASVLLAQLRREVILPGLIWRDAAGDFAGAKNDTISIRVPAYGGSARTRVLRSGTGYTLDSLTESKVDMTLDTDVYKGVAITDEELSLDIANFAGQVLSPITDTVARGVEAQVAAEMENAAYAKEVAWTAAAYEDLVDARALLNKAGVPMSERWLVVSADAESRLLKDDHLAKFDQSGSDSALRDASIGRMAGFTVLVSQELNGDIAIAGHKTAFAMALRAPAVPDGVPFGSSASERGVAMRVIRDYDFANVRDRLLANTYMGVAPVLDSGYFDSEGRWFPAEAEVGPEIDLTTSASADDIIDSSAAHGFVEDDRVVFTSLTGGTGLSTHREYFVIAANLAATTFQVSETLGGSAALFSTDITDGKVHSNGAAFLVRAVKIS